MTPVKSVAAEPFAHEAEPFERLLDSGEAAQLLQIHPKTLQKLSRAGRIPAYLICGLWRFRASELDRWRYRQRATRARTEDKKLFNRARYQLGSFLQKKRAKGPSVWEFRYYEMIDGVRKRQHLTLGTVVQFPTESAARKAAEGRLLKLNSEAPTIAVPRFGAIIDRFMAEELPDRHSTRLSYCSNIENHIRPKWGDYPLDKVKPLPAEDWLKQLPLAPRTRSHIRSLMHLMFEAAQRWELIDKNPMTLVRVKGGSKRAAKPPIITSEQFYHVLEFVPVKYRPHGGDRSMPWGSG